MSVDTEVPNLYKLLVQAIVFFFQFMLHLCRKIRTHYSVVAGHCHINISTAPTVQSRVNYAKPDLCT